MVWREVINITLTAQETASYKPHLMSSTVLVIVRPRTALCCSVKPLLQGLSAAVRHILILKFSRSIWNSVLLNSPPFSTKILLGWPKIPIQYWEIFFTILFRGNNTRNTIYVVVYMYLSCEEARFFYMGPFFKIHGHCLSKGFSKGKTNYWSRISSFIFNPNLTLFI